VVEEKTGEEMRGDERGMELEEGGKMRVKIKA
jgi:hypothetical protein